MYSIQAHVNLTRNEDAGDEFVTYIVVKHQFNPITQSKRAQKSDEIQLFSHLFCGKSPQNH